MSACPLYLQVMEELFVESARDSPSLIHFLNWSWDMVMCVGSIFRIKSASSTECLRSGGRPPQQQDSML
jgi:hypothetical protein